MPSEVIKKENVISVESKEDTEQSDTKLLKNENNSQEKKIDDQEQLNDSKMPDKLSEKENQEPIIEDVELKIKRAKEILIIGKRSYIIKDYQTAVDILSEACSRFGTIYGEMAEECAEAYYMYGCALLELSKLEINPIGLEEKDDDENKNVSIEEESLTETDKNVVINKEEKSFTSVEKNEVEDKLTKNIKKTDKLTEMEEKKGELEDKSIGKKEKDDLEDKVIEKKEKSNELETKTNELTDKEETNVTEEEMYVDEEEKPDEKFEDEVNDLQLAWEMLDLAKVIYKNKDTEESKLKLAEVLMKCGEVSIEDEKFETAIEDITESLQIRRLLLPEDSRVIAETLFQLGIAQELGGSGDQAVEFLTEATVVLNQRIKTLEDLLTDKNSKAIEEMAEIKAIIPEIQEKIVDIKERKKAAVSALLAAVCADDVSKPNGEASSTSTQATNISHLVRKRPKQDDTDGTPNKVPKHEESTATEK